MLQLLFNNFGQANVIQDRGSNDMILKVNNAEIVMIVFYHRRERIRADK